MSNIEAANKTDKAIQVMKNSLFTGFSQSEVEYCLLVAERLKLDPLLKQVHFVKRQGKIVSQTGIDGFRLVAQRSGEYAGSDTVYKYAPDDKKQEHPIEAIATVYRIVQGMRVGFSASARWSEYMPADGQNFMWKKMPHQMLGKCAEANALRKGFPAELSGLYADEEMAQADAGQAKAHRINEVIAQPIKPEVPLDVMPTYPEEIPVPELKDEPLPGFGNELGDIPIPGKKYLGKKLKEVDREELGDYLIWVQEAAQKKGKEPGKEWKELFEAYDKYYGVPTKENV